MKALFIDDERVPGDVTWVDIAAVCPSLSEWNVVRSYDAAVDWVTENGFPDVVSFDHDMGCINGDVLQPEKSGYDVARFLIDYDLEHRLMPASFTFVVHSTNPVGKKNIEMLFNRYMKFKNS